MPRPHPCCLLPVSYQILWVSFLITRCGGGAWFASHLPVCCSLCQEQSNRPSVPSPYLLSKAPLLHEQEPVAKGGRQARGQVRLTQGQWEAYSLVGQQEKKLDC